MTLQEAHALCPEGADISETYRKPAHIPGTSAGAANFIASPAGLAEPPFMSVGTTYEHRTFQPCIMIEDLQGYDLQRCSGHSPVMAADMWQTSLNGLILKGLQEPLSV